MAGPDYVRSMHQIAYDPPTSPGEKALAGFTPLSAIEGPVNLTWNRPAGDMGRYIWPDA
ncbi:hypothetical protein [uncultured Arthrobacter sp.]|uniref:hypothetical protein n=1 Tax=uncultured Arthrobacter sp. TaxID=114050 RepID=UPI002602FE59|nr:hypothetical protein [uncultured Arthrobacter sp.]